MKKIKNGALKYILWLVLGGIGGFLSALILDNLSLDQISHTFNTFFHNHHLGIQLSILTPLTLITLILYILARKALNTDSLTEDQEDTVDTYLTISMAVNILAIIINFMLTGMIFSINASKSFETTSTFLISIFVFLGFQTFESIFEVYTVKTIKKLHPNKKGDPLDVSFSKDWFSSCDEGEKTLLYASSYKVSMLLRNTFIFVWVILALMTLVFPIGILPFILVAFFWGIHSIGTVVYSSLMEKGKIKY